MERSVQNGALCNEKDQRYSCVESLWSFFTIE